MWSNTIFKLHKLLSELNIGKIYRCYGKNVINECTTVVQERGRYLVRYAFYNLIYQIHRNGMSYITVHRNNLQNIVGLLHKFQDLWIRKGII